MVTWDKTIALEDRRSLNNTFLLDKMVFNLPETTIYGYQNQWVYKERIFGFIVAYLFVYVDDWQHIGPIETLCLEESKRWRFTCSWLGIQDVSKNIETPPEGK